MVDRDDSPGLDEAQAKAQVAELKTIIDQQPHRLDAHLALADALCVLGRAEDAAEALSDAAKLLPQEPLIWDKMAAVRLKLNDWVGTAEALAEQVQRDPDNPEAYANWITFAIAAQDAEAAVRASNEFMERHPQHWKAHYFRGRLYDTDPRHRDLALASLRKAHALAPEEWQPLNDLGETLNAQALEKQDVAGFAEAVMLLERSRELAPPEQPEPRYNLALALWNSQRGAEAIDALDELLDQTPIGHPLRETADRARQAMARELEGQD
ncbi:MAG: tetratricopeptide repeat protein [Candidatus Competibacterales bacterium]